jgi:hypothetical protein
MPDASMATCLPSDRSLVPRTAVPRLVSFDAMQRALPKQPLGCGDDAVVLQSLARTEGPDQSAASSLRSSCCGGAAVVLQQISDAAVAGTSVVSVGRRS